VGEPDRPEPSGTPEQRLTGLIERYRDLIVAAVARVAKRRDADLADEVSQRVAEALWKQLRAEQTIEHPASYLYRCAVRETVRLLQQEIARGHVPLEDRGDLAPGPDDALRSQQAAARVDGVLAALPADRAVAVRAHLAGYTVEEIMQAHGWPYQKARNLIARGMADLRTRLAEEGWP